MKPSRNCTYTAGLPRLRWWAVGALLAICGLAQGEFRPRDRHPVWLVGDAAELLVSDTARTESGRAAPTIRLTGCSPCLYAGMGIKYLGAIAAGAGVIGLMAALTYDPVGPAGPEYKLIWVPQVLMIVGGVGLYFLGKHIADISDFQIPGSDRSTEGMAANDHIREYARRLDASLARSCDRESVFAVDEAAAKVTVQAAPVEMPNQAEAGLPSAAPAGRRGSGFARVGEARSR